MTSVVCKAVLLSGCCLVVAGSAISQPSQANSTFPANGILLVGRNNTFPVPQEDIAGEFSVTVRDATPVVLTGVVVTVDFSACTPDIRVCNPQTFPGLSMSGCPGGPAVVSAITNALGVATFRITGGAFNSGNSPSAGGGGGLGNVDPGCAELRAQGVFFNTLTVAAVDQNSASILNGFLANDFAVAFSDVLDFPEELDGRTDFNYNDRDLPNDLAIMVGLLVRIPQPSLNNCGVASACP